MIIQLDNETAVNPEMVWWIQRGLAGQSEIKVGIGKWVDKFTVNLPMDEIITKLNVK